jgi:aminoglycoside phosphotransferase family enzyme/predicted kinase
VDLGFLDFSTLGKRKYFCEEELRVNRRTAPELYLEVLPIGGPAENPRFGAEPAIEYALRMRQFPYAARLDRCLQAGQIGSAETRRLAAMLAHFHESLPPLVDADPEREALRASKPARNNFRYLDPALFSDESQQQLAVIESWTLDQAEALMPAFARRVREGFMRECHGDLHLENLVCEEGRFVPFDAIEFDPDLRRIDTANDIAFLAMDLAARNHPELAYTLLSAWLEENGDYPSLEVMRFYLVYRSIVRAVVTSIRRQQGAPSGEDSSRLDAARYIELAAGLVDTPPSTLILMHGLSGSGKTWLSERLVSALPALRVRSDLERKRLAGQGPDVHATETYRGGIYRPEMTDLTYQAMADGCEQGLRAGFNMIADATFLRRRQRERFHDLAERLGVPSIVVDCRASEDLLRQRIEQRSSAAEDASDANLEILQEQLRHHDPLDQRESGTVVRASTEAGAEDAIAAVAAALRGH